MNSYGAETPDNAERWQRQNYLNQEENKVGKFKVGDRVKCIGKGTIISEKIGTVVCFDRTEDFIGVAFDRGYAFGSALMGNCKMGHGFWVRAYDLELINDEHRFNLIITSVGDVTTAKLLHGKKLEKEVSVKRYHKDEYSAKAAVAEVCKKLFGEDKPEEKPEPKGINCKAVYISASECGFTRGKIYDFVDGRCIDDTGWARPISQPIISPCDRGFSERFLIIVGETK